MQWSVLYKPGAWGPLTEAPPHSAGPSAPAVVLWPCPKSVKIEIEDQYQDLLGSEGDEFWLWGIKIVTLVLFCSMWALLSNPSFCLMSSSNFLICCWKRFVWAVWFSISLCKCLGSERNREGRGNIYTTTFVIYIHIFTALLFQDTLVISSSRHFRTSKSGGDGPGDQMYPGVE